MESKNPLELKKELLETQFSKLNDQLLYEDSTENQVILREKLSKIEKELVETVQKMHLEAETRVNAFMNRIFAIREKNSKTQRDRVYNIAREDAERRVYSILCVSPEKIAEFFSTDKVSIDYIPNTHVCPPRMSYTWPHDLRNYNDNNLPLSPGIEQPKMMDKKTGKIKDIKFYVDYYYSNLPFIEKCRQYYTKFGLLLFVERDRIPKCWIITMKVNENNIYF